MSDRELRLDRPTSDVAVVTLQRPDHRNAIGWQTWAELDAALGEASADGGTRALVLTGAAGCFSAGGDVKTSPSRGEGIGAPSARLSVGHRVVTRLMRLPVPTIAAVEGFAVGVAWSLVLCCDLVVAAEDAFFAAPFTQRGLAPDGGLAWFLTRSLGRNRAAELLMLGDRLPAPAAAAAGLVNRVVPPGNALDTAVELARRLITGAPDALMLTKRMIRAADPELDRFLDVEWFAATLALHGPEAVEGRAAFAEKRPADFTRRAR